MAARVIVSMFAETIGRFSAIRVVNRVVRSMTAGSRLGTIPSCGMKRKSSNVQPRTSCSRSISVRHVDVARLRHGGAAGSASPARARAGESRRGPCLRG